MMQVRYQNHNLHQQGLKPVASDVKHILLTYLGVLQGVVAVMQSSAGDVKDDAAGVLRNCSNYSVEATEVRRNCKPKKKYLVLHCWLRIKVHLCAGHRQVTWCSECTDRNVQRRGKCLLSAASRKRSESPFLRRSKEKKTSQHAQLTQTAPTQHKSDGFTAMGTIQNLTRCKKVLPLLCQTAVIRDAVIPVLNASGSVRPNALIFHLYVMHVRAFATGFSFFLFAFRVSVFPRLWCVFVLCAHASSKLAKRGAPEKHRLLQADDEPTPMHVREGTRARCLL